MANYTPTEMAAILRRCAAGTCDDQCPFCDVPTNCDDALMQAAAEVLEEVPHG